MQDFTDASAGENASNPFPLFNNKRWPLYSCLFQKDFQIVKSEVCTSFYTTLNRSRKFISHRIKDSFHNWNDIFNGSSSRITRASGMVCFSDKYCTYFAVRLNRHLPLTRNNSKNETKLTGERLPCPVPGGRFTPPSAVFFGSRHSENEWHVSRQIQKLKHVAHFRGPAGPTGTTGK